MLDNELTLRDIFSSSGNSLRINAPRDDALIKRYLDSGAIAAKRTRLSSSPSGLLEYFCRLQVDATFETDIRVLIPQLRQIENKGGKLHELMCLASGLLVARQWI